MFACAVAACALSGAAQAQVMLPDTGLNIDAGLAIRGRPTHLGSRVYTTDYLPVIEGAWGKDFRFSVDDGIQYTAARVGRFSFGPDVEYRQPYNEKLAPRTRRTSNALEVGLFGKVDLTYAELEARFRKAVNGYEGYSGDITLDTLPKLTPKLYLGLEARLGWADRRFALNQFGVTPLPGQPAVTSIGDYYSAGAQAALIYMWRPRTKFILSVADDQILRPSRPQSGADTRNAATVTLAFTRRFSW